MRFLGIGVLAIGAIALGLWLTDTIATLTEVEGTKLLLAQIIIWSGIGSALTLWLARRPLIEGLGRWAAQTELGQSAPLVRSEHAGPLERLLGLASYWPAAR